MPTYALAIYTIKVQTSTGDRDLNTDSFYQGNDLAQVLYDYLGTRLDDYGVFDHVQRILKVDSRQRSGRTVNAMLRKGEYGIASLIVDKDTGNVTHRKTINEADLLPFYFVGAFPPQATRGILGFQTSGVSGVKGEFEYDFEEYFGDRFQDFRVRIEKLVTKEVVEFYLNGRITKVRLTNLRIPTDRADLYGLGLREEQVDTEFVINARRNLGFDIRERAIEVLGRERDLTDLVELEDFDFEGVKLEVAIGGGKYRTIDLGDADIVRARFDLGDLELGDDGNPSLESLDRNAREIISEILEWLHLDNIDV